MIKIALCDDLPDHLISTAQYLDEYLVLNSINAEVQNFAHPDELLRVCEVEQFHIYILDIVMPMINGIELGKEIRMIDQEAEIIYISTEFSFALESFSVNPINYIVKPIDKEKFFKTLDLAISKIDTDEEEVIVLKTKEGLRIIKVSSVISCEYSNHTAIYTLFSGEIIKTLTFQENFTTHVEPLLLNKRFIQPHSAFVVNMSRVEAFSRDGFVMRHGGVIPIPQKKYPSVRDQYMDYLLLREESK